MIQFTYFRRLILMMATIAAIVTAGSVEERQNPGFITTLPTVATNTIVFITTTATATNPPVQFTTTPGPFFQPTPAPSSVPFTSPTTTTTAITALQGPFFGGIPEKDLDIPLTSVFLILFLLGAIANAIFYRSNSNRPRRAMRDIISVLASLFCLARVLSCILRNAWAVAITSTGAIFLALVSENAGTAFLFLLNFYLAKRMIGLFNMRMSLWARTVVESFSKTTVIVCLAVAFLLNTVGVALFEFKSSESNGVSTAVNLAQISAALLLILGLTLLGTVLLVRLSAESPQIPRLTARTVVFFVGAGLLTMATQLVRMASTFYIWKDSSTMSEAILSKPTYYVTSMGFEILIIILYAFMRIDLLFNINSAPTLASIRAPASRSTTAASSKASSDSIFRMDSVVTKAGVPGSLPTTEYSLTDPIRKSPNRDSRSSGREQRIEETVKQGSEDSQKENEQCII